MWRLTVALSLLVAGGAGCRFSDAQAIRVVNEYNRLLVDAYRTTDFQLMKDVTGPDEYRKITALIGVKSDQGLTMDSKLVDFRPVKVERSGAAVTVTTHERWYYLDRAIGTGQQVGQDSTDEYDMRYVLGREGGRWVVLRVEFASTPRIGRTEVPGGAKVPAQHFGTRMPPGADPREGGVPSPAEATSP